MITKTFDTYEEAKVYGGDKCVVLTTAEGWNAADYLVGKFVAAKIVDGKYFEVTQKTYQSGDFWMNEKSGWIVVDEDSQKPFSDFAQNVECMAEADPNGISQHEAGAKLDNGKPMAGRLLAMFGNALYAVSEVGTFGANKYTEGGWQHVQDGFKRYDDAGMRHFLKRGMGEEVDPDSNLPHLAHEAWNALAKLELYLRDKAK